MLKGFSDERGESLMAVNITTNLVIQLIINGLLTGAFYALVALGLTIIWGVTRIINIAHGEFVMLGAFITYFISLGYGLDPYLSAFIAAILMAIIGMGIQYTLYNRVRDQPELITLIITFGVSITLIALMIIFFTADFRTLNNVYRDTPIIIGPIVFSAADLLAAIFSLILIFGISFFLNNTYVGRAILAVAQDREAALLMGIDEEKIYVITMGISAFSAGFAGGILATLYTFTPYDGGIYMGLSFAITILGGLGSIPGALIGAIIVGLVRAGTTLIKSGLEPAIGFIIMIIVLILRPRGLFGRVSE